MTKRREDVKRYVLGLIACSVLSTPVWAQGAAGTLLNDTPAVESRVDGLVKQMTLDEKIELIGGYTPFRTHPIDRLKIPSFQMADGPVGAHIPAPTIAYAAGIGLAASWDRGLAVSIGQQLGRDSKSRGAAFLLGPGINIYRAPMNGRNFEYFGEDPFLQSEMAVGYITGVQQEGVSATVKHFVGNNSEYQRHSSDSVIGERALREIYLPGFEAAVKRGHVGAIMDAYNLTNGEHMTANGPLNLEVVKKDWRYSGLIMSDWVAVYDTVKAANGGLDLEMPFGVYFAKDKLQPEIDNGKVTQATIDDKVRRILRVADTFGWLNHAQMDTSISRYNRQGLAVTEEGALEGMVLLKNEGHALPLKREEIKTLAVIGPTAAPTPTTGGGSGEVVSFASSSILTGLSDALADKANVLYARGMYSLNQLTRTTHFTTDAAGTQAGVRVEHFNNAALNGTPQTTTVEPVMLIPASTRRTPEEQEVNALTAKRGQVVYVPAPASARWTGYYTPETAGEHFVFVQTEGRFRLLIDDKVVIDNSKVSRAILNQTRVPMAAGPHKVELEQLGTERVSMPTLHVGIAPVSTIVDPAALAIAKQADAVVLAVGFDTNSESEGGDRSFDLPVGQDELIKEVAALGKKTIVLITSGGSVNLMPWKDSVQGIFEAWYPGERGGDAVAKVLFGEANPSGHLPISWESKIEDNPSYKFYYPEPGTSEIKYGDGIYVGYRGYEHEHRKPLFPFGYGLSYTTFKYGNLNSDATGAGRVRVTFDVTNTGDRAGATVPQLYVAEEHPSIDRPEKELKSFDRVMLQPGETKHVVLELTPRSFSFWDVKRSTWHADAGEYRLLVGSSSEQIELEGKVKLSAAIDTGVSE